MATVKFSSEAEYNAAVDAAVNAAIEPIKIAHAAEIAALNELLAKAREQNATADYSAFEKYPDLIALLKKTDLRPGALPAMCALKVWEGFKSAKEIAAAIGKTPELGKKGGVDANAKMITSALQKLESALLQVEYGADVEKAVGVKVTSIRGKEGDSSVRKIYFVPVREVAEIETSPSNDAAPSNDAGGEQQAA